MRKKSWKIVEKYTQTPTPQKYKNKTQNMELFQESFHQGVSEKSPKTETIGMMHSVRKCILRQKSTFLKSHFSRNSHFQNINFHKIHISKLSRNSYFMNSVFHKNHIFFKSQIQGIFYLINFWPLQSPTTFDVFILILWISSVNTEI